MAAKKKIKNRWWIPKKHVREISKRVVTEETKSVEKSYLVSENYADDDMDKVLNDLSRYSRNLDDLDEDFNSSNNYPEERPNNAKNPFENAHELVPIAAKDRGRLIFK